MTSTVWTQSASLHWAPELRFYEHRAGILRLMKEVGLLTAFRVGDSEAGAQLGDRIHEVEFSHRNLVARVRSPTGDVERVLKAVEIVLSELRPTGVAMASFSFQHLYPLDMEYDAARRTSLAAMFGSPELGPVVAGDFANLIDGVAAEPASTVGAEYGVVTADEIPRRLARQIGRAPDSRRSSPRPIPEADLSDVPAVALFIDANWTLTERIADEDVLDRFNDSWQACRNVSEDFAEAIRAQLFGPNPEREDPPDD